MLFFFITQGYINAFRDIGIDARYWDGNLRTFTAFKPDLYIGSYGHKRELPRNRNFKLALHVNPYGPKKLDKIHGVDINSNKNDIDWVIRQGPDVVFGYGHQDDFEDYWQYWTLRHNIPFVGLPCAGDSTLYYPDGKKTRDAAYLGGRWPFKAHKIDKWLLPVTSKIDIKGWGNWKGINGFSGELPQNDCGRKFLSSAKVCPCISEPHTSIYGIDIPERFFKAALCGSLPISDYVPGFDRYYPKDYYIMANNPKEYDELIKKCMNSRIRVGVTNKLRKLTLENHTYHNRMMKLCEKLGFDEVSKSFKQRIKKL